MSNTIRTAITAFAVLTLAGCSVVENINCTPGELVKDPGGTKIIMKLDCRGITMGGAQPVIKDVGLILKVAGTKTPLSCEAKIFSEDAMSCKIAKEPLKGAEAKK